MAPGMTAAQRRGIRARFEDQAEPSSKHWKWTILSSLAKCSSSGFHAMFLILAVMLTLTAAIGWMWGPRTEGMSLEEIEEARAAGELAV